MRRHQLSQHDRNHPELIREREKEKKKQKNTLDS